VEILYHLREETCIIKAIHGTANDITSEDGMSTKIIDTTRYMDKLKIKKKYIFLNFS
jgi:hypothetical protein